MILANFMATHHCTLLLEKFLHAFNVNLKKQQGHLECVRALLLECPSATLQANKWGNIPLHVACLSNYVLVAKTILDSTLVGEENTSQQINWRNSKDDTPLHYAYRHNTR